MADALMNPGIYSVTAKAATETCREYIVGLISVSKVNEIKSLF